MPNPHSSFTESIPKTYDAFLGPMFFAPYAADITRRVPAMTHGRILELAAGTGILTRRLRTVLPSDVEIVATDLNDAMLEHARTKFTRTEPVTWSVADATKLPFDDASFDVVLCQFGFMFFPDKQAAFDECLRVLRPGGVLIFNVWESLEHNDVARMANDAVERHFPADPPTFYHTPYGSYDVRPLLEMLKNAGFESTHHSSVSRPGESPSPHAAATGIVEGTPASVEIRQRDAGKMQSIVADVERQLTAQFGAGAIRPGTRAIVFSSRKR